MRKYETKYSSVGLRQGFKKTGHSIKIKPNKTIDQTPDRKRFTLYDRFKSESLRDSDFKPDPYKGTSEDLYRKSQQDLRKNFLTKL